MSHGKGKKVVIKKQQHNSCNRFLLDLKIHDWSDIKKQRIHCNSKNAYVL